MLQALSVASIDDTGGEELRVVDLQRRPLRGAGGADRDRLVLPAHRREGEDDLIGAGIHFCATCDGPFYKGSEELLVLGGGNSGLEEGLFLTQFTDKVTVVEYKDRLAGSQVLQDKVAADPKMDVLLSRKVVVVPPKDDGSGKIGTVVLENVADRRDEEHHPAGVFVFVGLDPNTGFLDGHRSTWTSGGSS